MNRRWNLFFAIPIITALIAYFLTQRLLFTALGFFAGYLLMEGLRFLFLPPYLHRAVRRYQKGDLETALELTEKSIAARPARWESVYLHSLIKFSMSELDGAEQSASKAVALKSDEPATHLLLGQILYTDGRYAEAIEALDEAIENGGKGGIHYFYAGASRYRLGQYADAVPRLELALRLGIDNPQLTLLATFYLAECLKRTQEVEAAEDYYDQLSRYSKALANLEEDLHIVPDYPERNALRQDVGAIAKLIQGQQTV